jgi:hypothetical protein
MAPISDEDREQAEETRRCADGSVRGLVNLAGGAGSQRVPASRHVIALMFAWAHRAG